MSKGRIAQWLGLGPKVLSSNPTYGDFSFRTKNHDCLGIKTRMKIRAHKRYLCRTGPERDRRCYW